MKTLILYASKSGYAKGCAQRVSEALGDDAELVDIGKRQRVPDLAGFEQVVAGGSVRAGHISGALRKFLAAHEQQLLDRRLGLFLCGTDPDNLDQQFANHYPKQLLDHAVAKEWFGGRIVFAQQNPFMRFMLKKILKGEEDVHKEQPKAVESFIAAMTC